MSQTEGDAVATADADVTHDQAYNNLVGIWEQTAEAARTLNDLVVYVEGTDAELAANAQLRPAADGFSYLVTDLQEGLTTLAGSLEKVGELQVWAEWADTELQQAEADKANAQNGDTNNGALLDAKAEIQRLKEELLSTKTALNAANASLDASATAEKSEYETLQVELESTSAALASANAELEVLKAAAEASKASPSGGDEEEPSDAKDIEKEIEEVKSELTSARSQIASLQSRERSKSKKISELEAKNKDLSSELKTTREEVKRSSNKAETAAAAAPRPDVTLLQNTVKRLQRDLDAARVQQRDMQELLDQEHEKQRTLQETLQKTLEEQNTRGGIRLPRPFTAPNRSLSSGNLDVLKVMTRNQALINDVVSQREENDRLRSDNAHLLLHVKDATRGVHELQNHIVTSQAHRTELQRRLMKTQAEKKLWESQLNRTAARTIRRHQMVKEADELYQWSQIERMQVRNGVSRQNLFGGKVGAPSGTRNIQVNKWSSMNTVDL